MESNIHAFSFSFEADYKAVKVRFVHLLDFLLFCSKELVDFGELVFVQAKAIREELDAESEELAVVVPIKYRVFDVAD